MDQWERPVYKKLAASELGRGHTSGIVPAKETHAYFEVPRSKDAAKTFYVEFWADGASIHLVTTGHYFIYSTHDHPHITGNILPAYKAAGAQIGDYIVFWKSKNNSSRFKAELIKAGSARYLEAVSNGSNLSKPGGFLNLSPPGLPGGGDDNDYEDDYETVSAVDEELSSASFPPEPRQGRRKRSEAQVTYRDKAKGDFVLKQQNYKCQLDSSHVTFLTPSKLPYMEKHHLISMKYYEQFENDLDDIRNIVSLCPNCHRKIHLGNKAEIGRMLEILYKQQIDGLNQASLGIGLADLKAKYGVPAA